MNTPKSPLVQKLILLVLTLNLACFVIFLVRDHQRQRIEAESERADLEGSERDLRRTGSQEEYLPLRPRRNAPPVPARTSNSAPASRVSVPALSVGNSAPVPSVEKPDSTDASVQVASAQVVNESVNVYAPVVLPGNVEIFGVINLLGDPPPEKSAPVDALCASMRGSPNVTSRHYVVSEGGGLANVFVYLKSGVRGKYPVPGEKALLNQAGCEYFPYVLGVQTEQRLNVLNSDSLMHNVHVLSTRGNKESNVAQVRKGQVNTLSFDHPEVFVKFKCDVHGWIFAYVGVVEHPFFAVTDANGVFRFPSGIPPGKYTVAAVHLKAGELTQELTVSPGDRKSLQFDFNVPNQNTARTAAR